MKILVCHNYYQQRGGEDQVFADEAALLTDRGHEVIPYTLHNDAIDAMGRLKVAARTMWNRQSYRELRALIRRERPRLMHCTNTFPLISPAAYHAAKAEGAAVVQSLHNYRLICPKAVLMRDNRVCEDCLGKLVAWPAIRHGCYRESRAATTVLAGMLAAHRLWGTYRHRVDRYIVLTEFARQKFIEAGFPANRLAVKPNFVAPDPGPGDGACGYALFVGRLSQEKGVETLLSAWTSRPELPPLKIVGDGPLADRVRDAAAVSPHIDWLGARSCKDVQQLMGNAAFLVFPSIWYEGLPKTIIEAFSRGTPVVASRLGSMSELVEHNRTGLLFEAGNVAAMVQAVREIAAHPARLSAMRRAARQRFEAQFTAETNYERLMMIYAAALSAHHGIEANPLPAVPQCTRQENVMERAS